MEVYTLGVCVGENMIRRGTADNFYLMMKKYRSSIYGSTDNSFDQRIRKISDVDVIIIPVRRSTFHGFEK